MAEAVSSALASILLGNFTTGVSEELGRVFGLQTEFEKLKSTFETVQAVLKDAEEKQWKDEGIRIWLKDLKAAAYDADDVLDEFSIEAQRRRQRRGLKDRLRSFSSLDQNPLVFRFKMAHKLKNVKEKFDDIDMRKNKFELIKGVGENEADRFDWRITSSLVDEKEIYGRDNEKEELISMLLDKSDDLSVYAIHGMGGLGKTTLAQLVYSDASVERRFDLRIWVCVSDDFDIRRLTRAIIESIEDKPFMIEECCLIEKNRRPRIPKTVRHMSYLDRGLCYYDKDLVKEQSLRSLISFQFNYWWGTWGTALSFKVSSHNKLRTLGLSHFRLKKNLTELIGNLKHLRYLDVSCSDIRKLPESISSLQNLQTLDLSYCTDLYMLPKKMKDMKSLIYLDLTGCKALQCMPSGMGQLGCLRKLGMFIVGKEVGHHIGELQRLNYIGGELSIKDLDNVQGLADAQNANLARKTYLQSLSLSWREDESSSLSGANSEDVLCALEPHSNMKKLQISGYHGSKFPDWMLESRLPNLVEISLQSCMNCEHLPPFGKLRFLKHLQLKRMDTVKCIGSEMYGDGENPFPSLERLTMGEMMNLEDWETNTMGGREIFTGLHELKIEKCPKLVGLPIIPSVKYLTIGDCTVTLLSSVVNFTSITNLRIKGFDELAVLPDGLLQNHTCLQNLSIGNVDSIPRMRSLRSLSNQLNNLSSLKSLNIIDCDELESLPEGVQNLNSLEMLKIRGLPKITALPVLPSSLATLWIQYCEELTSLSEGLQYLTGLKDLQLMACVKLNSLPESIRHLNSLQSLSIWGCPGVSCLPNQIRHLTSLSSMSLFRCSNLMSLPEGIRNLEMLRELAITECPNLERRCKKEKGKDWPNIALIRTIIINDQVIQSLET
ncbi:hypothetical protein OIU77_001482 [Salix suchowensis]|uniref:Uncharacterized protein n=1 Tax=Salix suchowensis TaxID=1278906 RepID=A0ABQ9B3Q4_9ROSI|nr:hypothetical protein OIU77_001482 [Salix suchowensis]